MIRKIIRNYHISASFSFSFEKYKQSTFLTVLKNTTININFKSF